MSRTRILVVDDHPMVRQGLASFLALADDMDVVGEAFDAETALQALTDRQPDVALVDLELPGRSGLWLIAAMAEAAPTVRALVLTSFVDAARVRGALSAGARGYLLKRVAPEDLLAAIRQVAAGRTVLDPEAAALVAAQPDAPHLTARERDVLGEILAGRSNKEIADALCVSERTVKGHVSALLAKLGCQDRTQIVIAAYRLGLAQP